jgi:hypothetical protein
MDITSQKKMGRPAGEIIYKDIIYNNKQYIVAKIYRNGNPIKFVFDKDDEEKVKKYFWHSTSVGYISSSIYIDGKEKQVLLHRLIMNVPHFPGKGAKETIDHINRNPLDNRKENLRTLSQTEQNINTSKRIRIIKFPEGCNIVPDDIPRHITYIRPNGGHGERFTIEFKTENIRWKTTSSKSLSIYDKLEQAKNKLKELYTQYPHLDPNNPEIVNKINDLNLSFNIILELCNS